MTPTENVRSKNFRVLTQPACRRSHPGNPMNPTARRRRRGHPRTGWRLRRRGSSRLRTSARERAHRFGHRRDVGAHPVSPSLPQVQVVSSSRSRPNEHRPMTRFDDELAIPSFPVSGFAPRLLRHGSPSLRSWRSRCVRRVGYPRFFHRPLPVTIPNSTCPMVPKCYRPRASFHLSHRIPPPATRHHLPRHRPARRTHRHGRRGPRLGRLPDHPAARPMRPAPTTPSSPASQLRIPTSSSSARTWNSSRTVSSQTRATTTWCAS